MTAARHARDTNLEVASALYDLSILSDAEYARVAYARAGHAILVMDSAVVDVAHAGALRELRYIGPASERVIREVLERGASTAVARAVSERAAESSPRVARLAERRALRAGFMSRAEARRVLSIPAPGAVSPADYRGDLQMHTRWSDGGETVAAMADAARARGQRFIAVTDHSYGLKLAGGVSMEDIARQHVEIDELNARWNRAFRVIKGIEANIPAAGGVDLAADELARFELVLAAPHSRLRTADDQTPRMLAAVRTPGVHVLAHPRGRMFTRRGVVARWEEVFGEAAAHDVAVELDGDPWRQDLDWRLACVALEQGCVFALDSDAHAGRELAASEFALAHARRAGIPAERVINCWSVERLLEWAAHRGPRHAGP